MTEFRLDERLARDCIALATEDNIRIMLLNNALVPWFVLVPEVEVKELFELTATQRADLVALENRMSRFVLENFDVQKLNVAAIGNVVSQMHIHVIGRKPGDYCWPGVVWGNLPKQDYADDVIIDIRQKLDTFIRESSTT